MVTHVTQAVGFIAAHQVPKYLSFDLNEIIDLSWAVASLASIDEDNLLQAYFESFQASITAAYLPNLLVSGYRMFGTILPNYRNKPPLKYNLNDTQIVLALCYIATGTNTVLPSRPYIAYPVSIFDSGYEGLRFVSLTLLPIALTQSRHLVHHVLNHVQYGSVHHLRPSQNFQYSPTWITGCSYAKSIKNPTHTQAKTIMPQMPHTSTATM